MIISKLEYHEKVFGNKWELKKTNLGMHNLIIGLNATGKTRFLKVILDLKSLILKSKIYSIFMKEAQRSWNLEFLDFDSGTNLPIKYAYKLELSEKQVDSEELSENENVLIERKEGSSKIFSKNHKMIEFSPPEKELTVNVRRDKIEFPFLEKLWSWANDFLEFNFTQFTPYFFMYQNTPERYNQDLVVSFLKNILIAGKKDVLLSDFTNIGYPIKSIKVNEIPNGESYIDVEENSLEVSTTQHSMSQGMFRALSIIIIVEYLLSNNIPFTLVIDDIGEGLDFERSSNLTKLVMEKIKNTRIQLIAASNDRFLINAVELGSLNVLERTGHTVVSFSRHNSSEAFDEFTYTGLNNFDLLTGKMYKE
ncbi:MAG: ATP-binding protein [Nitrospirae bacterium YQR-1]